MKTLLTLAAVLALLLAPAQIGAETAASTENVTHSCTQYTLCAAEADTGVCKIADGTSEITARVSIPSTLTFEHDQSAGNWTCNIIASSQSFTDASGAGDKINTSALTQANLAPVVASGGLRGWFWASCPTISSTVTLLMTACPIR